MERLSFFDRMKQFMMAIPQATSPSHKHILCCMFTYARDDGSGIYASVQTIAKLAGESERTTERAIGEFRKNGWLVDDGWHDNGFGQATKMRRLDLERLVMDRKNMEIYKDRAVIDGGGPGQEGRQTVQKGPSQMADKPKSLNQTKNQDTLVSEFEDFYFTYPRREARGQAERAYKTARKTVSHAVIMLALAGQIDTIMGKDPQFRKLPATWLNAKCWLDDKPEQQRKPDNLFGPSL